MDQLAALHSFAVPQGLLEQEFSTIWKQIEEAKARGALDAEDKGKSDDELRKDYRSIAERRIRLGLLLAEIARHNKIEVSGNELRSALMDEARRYPGQEKAVFDYYTRTKGAMEQIRAPLLEEKIIDFVVSKAQVSEKTVSIDALRKLAEAEEQVG